MPLSIATLRLALFAVLCAVVFVALWGGSFSPYVACSFALFSLAFTRYRYDGVSRIMRVTCSTYTARRRVILAIFSIYLFLMGTFLDGIFTVPEDPDLRLLGTIPIAGSLLFTYLLLPMTIGIERDVQNAETLGLIHPDGWTDPGPTLTDAWHPEGEPDDRFDPERQLRDGRADTERQHS
jgi:hypothetical protein